MSQQDQSNDTPNDPLRETITYAYHGPSLTVVENPSEPYSTTSYDADGNIVAVISKARSREASSGTLFPPPDDPLSIPKDPGLPEIS